MAEADEVIAAAERRRDRTVACYQNRRRDADFLTLRKLIDDGMLGDVTRYEARFDRWAPVIKDRWQERDGPGVGIHFDLGAHLVDQALALFGMPDWVQGDLQRLRSGTDPRDRHRRCVPRADGSRGPAHRARRDAVGARAPDALPGAGHARRVGSRGTSTRRSTSCASRGMSPGPIPRYGVEPVERRGTLTTIGDDGTPSVRTVPSERGDWASFYAELAASIRGGTPPPVTAREARDVIRVIEAVVESSRTGCRVALR